MIFKKGHIFFIFRATINTLLSDKNCYKTVEEGRKNMGGGKAA